MVWLNLVVLISMDLLPIRLGMKYWSNWVEIHWDYLYACLYIVWLYGLVEFGGLNLNGFTPNSTGQIRPVGRIQPGMKYWSNWVEIH